MSDDILKRIARSGGCRLCLAPDSECVPIFATAAADKEPLSNKILSCIGIKVSRLNLFHFVFFSWDNFWVNFWLREKWCRYLCFVFKFITSCEFSMRRLTENGYVKR